VPTLETPMSPGGSQASAGEGLSPCNIGILVLVMCVRERLQRVVMYFTNRLWHA